MAQNEYNNEVVGFFDVDNAKLIDSSEGKAGIVSQLIPASSVKGLTTLESGVAQFESDVNSGIIGGIRGWSTSVIFSSSAYNSISWESGTISLSNGIQYNVLSGSLTLTGTHYVYIDTSVSETVLQTTTNDATPVGQTKIMVAIAIISADTTTKAIVKTFGGQGDSQLITEFNIAKGAITTDKFTANTISGNIIQAGTLAADKIVAGSITTDRFTSNSINASVISAGTLTADKLSAALLYAGSIQISTGGNIRSGQTGYATGTGWFLGNSDEIPKFSIGDSDKYMRWNGTDLEINGKVTTGVGSTIDGSYMVNGTLTVNKLAFTPVTPGSGSNSVSSSGYVTSIDASSITVSNINADNITSGTITGRTFLSQNGQDTLRISQRDGLPKIEFFDDSTIDSNTRGGQISFNNESIGSTLDVLNLASDALINNIRIGTGIYGSSGHTYNTKMTFSDTNGISVDSGTFKVNTRFRLPVGNNLY